MTAVNKTYSLSPLQQTPITIIGIASLLILKRLEDAERDGDRIDAMLKSYRNRVNR